MNITHISEAALIAVHGIGAVSKNPAGNTTTVEIARLIRASENHIAKVMQRLVKSGLLKSARGPAGGFSLARKPEKITLLDIFIAIEDKKTGSGCRFRKRQCVFKDCVFSGILDKLENEFQVYIKSKTLADLREE